jgi:hypothetical protein
VIYSRSYDCIPEIRQASVPSVFSVVKRNMPTFLTLDQIRQKVDDLMQVIDAPRNLQPTYGYSDQMEPPKSTWTQTAICI